jgi:integrase
MAVRAGIVPQRTLDLQSMSKPHQKRRLGRKGIPTGAKWHFTNKHLTQLLSELRTIRDKAMVMVGAYVGFRISELLSWTLADVLDADGNIKHVIGTHSLRKSAARRFLEASGNDMSKTAAFLGHCTPATPSASSLHDGFELFQAMQGMEDTRCANVT